jgi:hypothetical protein
MESKGRGGRERGRREEAPAFTMRSGGFRGGLNLALAQWRI